MGMVYIILALCILLGIILRGVWQCGQREAHIQILKQEAKEAARVQKIKQDVERMPLADVRRRLYNTHR